MKEKDYLLCHEESNGKVTAANLQPIEVEDNTQTKGKVSSKFTLVEDSETEESFAKVDKNKLFAEVDDYFCPIKFDDTLLRTSLQPLVTSGIMSVDVMEITIAKAKKEFLDANSELIEKANTLSIDEVIAKLQSNESLYKKVCAVCCVKDLDAKRYIDDNGSICIYRAQQCTDKDGNNRYIECTLSSVYNGKVFSSPLFVEKREQTTTNCLLAIRYYSSKQNASKKLMNAISDYKRILSAVSDAIVRARENGFTREQIEDELRSVYND